MSDPRAFQVDSVSVVDCDVCGHDNQVTYWDDLRTGRWEREAFACQHCGEYHREIDGNSLERGTVPVLTALFLFGLALALIGSMVASHYLFLGGLALMMPAPTLGVIAALHRKDHHS